MKAAGEERREERGREERAGEGCEAMRGNGDAVEMRETAQDRQRGAE